MYLEKGHCHVSVPKLEVLLDMNNLQGTKQDLRSLLSSIGRRNRKARSHHSSDRPHRQVYRLRPAPMPGSSGDRGPGYMSATCNKHSCGIADIECSIKDVHGFVDTGSHRKAYPWWPERS